MHPRVLEVTERLIARSRATREAYLALIAARPATGRCAASCNAPTLPTAWPGAALKIKTACG